MVKFLGTLRGAPRLRLIYFRRCSSKIRALSTLGNLPGGALSEVLVQKSLYVFTFRLSLHQTGAGGSSLMHEGRREWERLDVRNIHPKQTAERLARLQG